MSAIKPKHGKITLHLKALSWFAKMLTNKESFSAYLEQIIQLFKPEWRHKMVLAKVVAKHSESKNIYTLTLKPGKKWTPFQAGQFILLSAEINGRLLTRTFSISSAPRDFENTGLIEVSIRAQDKGSVTPWLKANLKAGNTLYISQAMGEFVIHPTKAKKVFIAGGSGITPIRSMLKENIDSAWLKDAHLFFYLKRPEDAIFAADLYQLSKKGLQVHHIFTEQQGRFSMEHLSKQISESDLSAHEYYICGPGNMITDCSTSLSEAGINQTQIHSEFFGAKPAAPIQGLADDDAHEFIQVDYLDSRKQVQFTSGTVTKTLLELAEEEGLKPVSGCRMGVCHQCICTKKQGRVFNTKTQTISDSGTEDIQLCLSVPMGPVELQL